MKIGRNEPCPCGSGKKYKRCCLAVRPDAAVAQAMQDAVLSPERARERVRSMHEVVSAVRRRCERRPGWRSAKYEAEKVQITVEELSAVAQETLHANPHSRQYIYVLLRRYGPQLWSEFREAIQFARLDANWLAETVKAASDLVLAGARPGEVWEWHTTETGEGIDYRDLKASDLADVSKILALGQLWYESKARFRYAAKGMRVFASGQEPDPLLTQDKSSVEHYERRRDRYDSLAGTAGLWYDPVVTPALRPDFCRWLGASAVKATGLLAVVSRNPPGEVPLTYFPRPYTEERVIRDPGEASNRPETLILTPQPGIFVATVPYDRLIRESASSIEAALATNAEELTTFLYAFTAMISDALCFNLLDLESTNGRMEIIWSDESSDTKGKAIAHWRDAGGLGLLRTSEDAWVHSLTGWANQITKRDGTIQSLTEARVREILRRFMWTEAAPGKKNIPLLFLRLSAHTVAVDVLRLADFLRYLFLQPNLIGRDDRQSSVQPVGDLTGIRFEDCAFQFFVRNLKLASTSAWLRVKIGKETEIDIAFVHRRVLFVLDCKAMAKDAEFMEGQYNKLRNRQSEFHRELTSKLPRRMSLIREGKARPTIEPALFDQAFGLVCTSAVEYLPLKDKEFWYNGSSLVGPPEELLDSIAALSGQPCLR